MTNEDPWNDNQRIITDEPKDREKREDKQDQNQHSNLVIKVSVPDWKVMAFTEPNEQLVWEHQVRCWTALMFRCLKNLRCQVCVCWACTYALTPFV